MTDVNMGKNKKASFLTVVIIVAVVMLMAFVLVVYMSCRSESSANPIELEGFYSIDNGSEVAFSGVPDIKNYDIHTLHIRAKVTGEIPKAKVIYIHVQDVFVTASINDTEIIHIDEQNKPTQIIKSPGNYWIFYDSMGIDVDDTIEITLTKVYENSTANMFSVFLSDLSYGNGTELYRDMLGGNIALILFGILIIFVGLGGLIIAVLLNVNRIKMANMIFALSFCIMLSGICMLSLLNIRYLSLFIPDNDIASIMTYYPCMLLPVMLVVCYSNNLYLPKNRLCSIIMVCLMLVASTTAIILQLCRVIDLCELQTLSCALFLCIIPMLGLQIFEAVKHKNVEAKCNILPIVPSVIGAIGQCIFYVFNTNAPPYIFQYGLYVTTMMQVIVMLFSVRNVLNTYTSKRQLESDLAQGRMAIMLSQIQPHFLYNSLTAIGNICVTAPEKAEMAIEQFAAFFRGNIDSLNSTKPIPLERELMHVKHYLSLEKLRFEDRLNIEYHINCRDFSLPALTIQPMVENAVRYGVTKREEGGTVTISTDELFTGYRIVIEDDGVGFDPMKTQYDGRSHIGLENVRSRLAIQCQGSLDIESTPGKGTKITIIIPKEVLKHDHHSS